MQKKVLMEATNWSEKYSDDKFSVLSTTFLSTTANSHGIEISPKVLRRDAPSILGGFLVAKIQGGDFQSHEIDEQIIGYAPSEQEVKFAENDAGDLEASCDFVLSKIYSEEAISIFNNKNAKSVSVEMMVSSDDDNPDVATGLNVFGLAVLGDTVRPSCPDAFASITRFSVEDAVKGYKSLWADTPEASTAELASDSENYKQKEEIPMDTEMIKEAEEETPVEASVDTEEVDAACGDKPVEAADTEEPVEACGGKAVAASDDEPEDDESEEEVEEVDNADMPAEEDNVDERIAELELAVEERDNRIAEMEQELSDLRAFKAAADEEQRAADVDEVMAEVEGSLGEEDMAELRKEGCSADVEFSAWRNKVLATAFSAGGSKKKPKKNLWGTAISFATNTKIEKPHGLWD